MIPTEAHYRGIYGVFALRSLVLFERIDGEFVREYLARLARHKRQKMDFIEGLVRITRVVKMVDE